MQKYDSCLLIFSILKSLSSSSLLESKISNDGKSFLLVCFIFGFSILIGKPIVVPFCSWFKIKLINVVLPTPDFPNTKILNLSNLWNLETLSLTFINFYKFIMFRSN